MAGADVSYGVDVLVDFYAVVGVIHYGFQFCELISAGLWLWLYAFRWLADYAGEDALCRKCVWPA